MKINTLSELIDYTISARRVEPVKRIKDLYHVPRGQRNRPVMPAYIFHKYEIKNGITAAQVTAENITNNNPLLASLVKRNDKSIKG